MKSLVSKEGLPEFTVDSVLRHEILKSILTPCKSLFEVWILIEGPWAKNEIPKIEGTGCPFWRVKVHWEGQFCVSC